MSKAPTPAAIKASLDLSVLAEPLARAERAMGALSHALLSTPFSRGWRLRHFRAAAAAETHLAGLAANPADIQIARLELSQGRLPIGGKWACQVLDVLQKSIRVRPAAVLRPSYLAALPFPRPGLMTFDERGSRFYRMEDDPQDMIARLEEWHEGFAEAPGSLLDALVALLGWHMLAPLGARQEPVSRLILAALIAKGRILPDLTLHTAPYEVRTPLPSPSRPQDFTLAGLRLLERAAIGERLELEGLMLRYRVAGKEIEAATTARSRLPEIMAILMAEEYASVAAIARHMARADKKNMPTKRGLRDMMNALERMGLAREVTGRGSFRIWQPSVALPVAAREAPPLPRQEFGDFEKMMEETRGLDPSSPDGADEIELPPSIYDEEEEEEDKEEMPGLDDG